MVRFFFTLLVLVSSCANALNVTLVLPSNREYLFWEMVRKSTEACAKDLGVSLEVIYGGKNRVTYHESIEKITKRNINKPDYLIIHPFNGNASSVFSRIEEAQLPYVTLERTFKPEESELVDYPQVIYSYWLAEITNDNVAASRLLTDRLIHKSLNKTQYPQRVMAFSGGFDDVSAQREAGMIESVENASPAKLAQIVKTHWTPRGLPEKFLKLKKRHPQAKVVWAAGSELALTLAETINNLPVNENKNYVVGGFDWSAEVFSKIESGDLEASVGGHFMLGAIGLIKLYDYHHGKVALEKGQQKSSLDLLMVTKDNVNQFKSLFATDAWDLIDFSLLSLKKNPTLKVYDFNLEKILGELTPVH